MADHQEKVPVSSSQAPSSSSLTPTTTPIAEELWLFAEERAQEILFAIQPMYLSERSRNEIINHLQTLMWERLGIEVFLFGSVPLKTYLPDGDIDLTVLTPYGMEENCAKALRNILEAERGESDFQVTDVQYIHAQVKVIKCTIRNVALDISFNQMAGLSALCFLEKVDRAFGRDHLFKRSIILIKAWCFYESRILGANSGLISTYALAILVLNIVNMSYSSVSGPLAVLYKFMDFYGSFDWENYCITVTGLVPISSFPDITETRNHEVFLDEKFFRECIESYSGPANVVEANRKYFPVKHYNILDPLKHSNNLGRSVSEGNAIRLRHCFRRGAQKLRDVLTFPGETVGWKLENFFGNSLDRNGKGQRQDVEEPVIPFGTGKADYSNLRGDFDGYFLCFIYGKWFHGESLHNWIPQGLDIRSWETVRWFMTRRRNFFNGRNLDGGSTSTSMPNKRKSKGTGTYIPEMGQQSYTGRSSSKPSTVTSLPSASQTHRCKKNPQTHKCKKDPQTHRCKKNPQTHQCKKNP
ncbi:polymerase nucleotidyl transferase domain [Arabidopsis suecica]|uniref:Polymerase nucleotidyl transferase domain n=1 Tax=Arabidopsis suecica TaxID=45249 RepID=A0A8T2AP00_ARASU|nr:polymerase nucleotidyl transferase domain [Arabidopsis suecica]KAG7574378.1 polymerase nucleotidyl transferase domain [Arabidopsis suecica]KAG7574379.1 polymerase nucleotidyl transferase domain [Arabidopsis suecica]